MPDVVLATFNSKYAHTAFALRYLQANLGDLQERSGVLEATLDDRPGDVVEKILALAPRVLGLSVYIWNAALSLELVRLLKQLAPTLVIVVGGPEVSYETESQEICRLADYTVTQEGDLAFAELCAAILAGQPPAGKIVAGGQCPLEKLQTPYHLYSDQDLAQRVVYLEASRGCPFRCEFCLSSLDKGVRYFPLEGLLGDLEELFRRGARRFKFIDRTFNLRIEVSRAILDFFLERYQPGLFLHFEMIPDRFPEELREVITRFPVGSVQFEIGIQTFNPAVGQRISRRQDEARLHDNIRFLREHSGVHIHADLIVGLPGEDIPSFGEGFDRLVELDPQEIQVGILKRLRGTPIIRHDQEFAMVYSANPPYEILQTGAIPFAHMQRLKRFARYWELLSNRGHFPATLRAVLGASPFANFLALTDWLFATTEATHKLGVPRLAELLADYLENVRGMEFAEVARLLARDYAADDKRYLPPFLLARADLPEELKLRPKRLKGDGGAALLPDRQARHVRKLTLQ
jgi:radical SAM superfamily enzyme YgiQ (UPF0313 family)